MVHPPCVIDACRGLSGTYSATNNLPISLLDSNTGSVYHGAVLMKTSFLTLALAAVGGMSLPVNAQAEEASAPSEPQVVAVEPGQSATIADEDGMTITVNVDELAAENADENGAVHIDADKLVAECPEVKQFLDAMEVLQQTLAGVTDAASAAAAVEPVQEQLAHLRAVGMLTDAALQAQPAEKRNQLSFVLMMTAFSLGESVQKLDSADFYDCAALRSLFLPAEQAE